MQSYLFLNYLIYGSDQENTLVCIAFIKKAKLQEKFFYPLGNTIILSLSLQCQWILILFVCYICIASLQGVLLLMKWQPEGTLLSESFFSPIFKSKNIIDRENWKFLLYMFATWSLKNAQIWKSFINCCCSVSFGCRLFVA